MSAEASAGAGLSDARQRLLALRLSQRRAAESGPRRRDGDGPAVLSSAQEGLWFLAQLEGIGGVYHSAYAWRLRGPLDLPRLEASLRALVERHESLRTRFAGSDAASAEVRQIVHPMAQIDAQGLLRPVPFDAGEADAAPLAERLAALAREPFDLACAPLLRAHWLRVGEAEHVLLVVVHHIVFDGGSKAVLMRELAALYGAGGDASGLPPLPVQVADHAAWQRERLASEPLRRQLDYWRRQLAGLAPLDLPTDRARPLHASYRGGVRHLDLPAPLTAQLRELARRENVTLFMLLLAAFKVLLKRFARQDDVAIGVPVAGRGRVELEGVVGCLVNSVVLRSDLSGNPGFGELLGRVRQTAIDAYAHDEFPFDRLVAALSPERDLSRNPLYQVSFALSRADEAATWPGGLSVEALPLPVAHAKFDLSLEVVERGDTLRAAFEYASDLFDGDTVGRMAGHWRTLLEAIVADSTAGIETLALLTPAERHRILVEWNDTDRPVPPPHCLHALIEARAARDPNATAAVFGAASLSYAELNARANRLAHRLRALGVGPDVPVGLCLERSLDLPVAALGILKAGGAYVPLDPTHPDDRLAFMLADCGAAVLVTGEALRSRLRFTTAELLCVDSDAALASEPAHDPQVGTLAEHLAYILYTSGSTGRPKGVQIDHRGVCNHAHWMAEALAITGTDRFLQKTSIGFDASIVELFLPLTRGATVVLAELEGERDTAYLARAVHEHRITVLQMVPSALPALLAEPALANGSSLRYLVCGGEALDRELAREVQRRLGGVRLGNFYGPTEASIDATWHPVQAVEAGVGTVPIGRPIANARCHALDARLQPVPIGVAGELVVGGPGLARGYLNRPDLDADRFVADPFRAGSGERLYRTGDLARYRADGALECIGRLDDQVKLRGFRIELGEIESALKSCDGVREAAVLLREDRPGLRQLVAYVAGDPGTLTGLRESLARRLPDYMVPALLVELPALPRLANGKLDRKGLPAPAQAETTTAYEAPRSPLEAALAAIWRELLSVPRVGVHDNFFELGGHSLLAMRAVARLREEMGVELPVRSIFEAPTLAHWARCVAGFGAAVDPSGCMPRPALPSPPAAAQAIEPDDEPSAPLPLSSAQQGLWMLDRMNGASPVYNVCRAIRLRGNLDPALLERSLQALLRRHESLRTAFEMNGETPHQVVHPAAAACKLLQLDPLPVSGADPADPAEPVDAAEREQALQARLQELAVRPFDLSQPAMLRACVLRLGPAEHVLVLVVHHIACDGWSLGVMLRELGLLYEHRGDANCLPHLPARFRDFATWQRERAGGEAFAQDLAYWRRQLEGLDALPLPTDRPRPPQAGQRGETHAYVVEPALYRSLEALARRENVTPFMLLLAAFKLLLMRYGGQPDVAVGSPVAGRHRVEFEGLIGHFVNTLVLRTDLSGDPSFAQLLGRVRQTCLDGFTHQEMPFDRLVAELAPERDAGRNPLYQVAFVLQNAPEGSLQLGALEAEEIPLRTRTAKFDLALSLAAQGPGLQGLFEYRTDLFDATTVERLARHFVRLLEGIAAEPARPLSRLPLMDEAEREQMLRGWNDTARPMPPSQNLHQLFEAQVRRDAQAHALVSPGHALSYGELNRRANRLAHHLREQGVARGVTVGLCMERGVACIVAMLAILKAGGAYVPLDPLYPEERLSHMLSDSAAAVLLTEQAVLSKLPAPALATIPVFCIDRDASQLAGLPDTDLEASAIPDDLAYVIYTSGSTGQPKGVAVPQRAVVRLVVDADYAALGPRSGIAQASNISFDAATFEIWGALLNGGRLVIVATETLLSAEDLERRIEADRIETMFLTTALFNEHAARSPAVFRQLDTLLFGGEGADPVAVQRVVDAAPPRRLVNVYGPTETTTFATWYEIAPVPGAALPVVPIGQPIANTTCVVLDDALEPVPVGATGELCIGGPGLARGYLNSPGLTAERFIADPFNPGERLYRSGDLARRLPDGNIVCLGRRDQQVKIRGYRIELAEIEAALSALAGVLQCAVLVGTDAAGRKRLVAHVVPVGSPAAPGANPASALRDRLAASLPAYMLPQAIVMRESLPLTANGKLDRRALERSGLVDELPAASAGKPSEDSADTLERELQALWEDVLAVRPVGLDQSFFDLGGHSLLAIRLLDRLDKRFGRVLRVGSLFQAPTVRRQAALLRLEGWRPPASCVVTLQPHGALAPLFFVSGYGGQILPLHALARELGGAQPLHVLDINSLADLPDAPDTVEGIAALMCRDMREVAPHGPYRLAAYSLGGKIIYEMAQQLRRAGEAVTLLALLDCNAPGYPPMRAFPVRVALHLRHAFRSGPREAARYLAGRLRKLRKYGRPREGPKLFASGEDVPEAAIVRALQAWTPVVFNAWKAYVPGPYPGRIMLINADEKPYGPGVRDDDPCKGWGSYAGGGVDVAGMSCVHADMLKPEHAAALAALLRERLEKG